MPNVTSRFIQSRYQGCVALSSTSVRSTCSGDTLRTPTSGRSANDSATQTPTPSPERMATGDSDTDTSTGSSSRTNPGSASWIATPSTAPTDAPASPISAACSPYTTSTCPLVAPRQRSTAIVSCLRRMNACTPDATPMPPSSSATRPTRPRKLPSVSIASVTFASDWAAVRTRNFSFSSAGLLRAAHVVACTPGGILSSVSYDARDPKASRRVSSSH